MSEVAQEDREASAYLIETYWSGADASMMKLAKSYRDGHSQGAFVRAFAAHRIAADRAGYERGQRETVERIVAWIRTGAMFAYTDQEMADAIEAGEWE